MGAKKKIHECCKAERRRVIEECAKGAEEFLLIVDRRDQLFSVPDKTVVAIGKKIASGIRSLKIPLVWKYGRSGERLESD